MGERFKGVSCRRGQDGKGVGKAETRKGEWMMEVVSVWEVDWEDVEMARGIVCS